MSHEWGNYPEDFTPKMYWGARAIVRDRWNGTWALDIPQNRQCFEQLDGSRMDKDDFIDWINSEVIPTLEEKVKQGSFIRWEDIAVVISDSGAFRCEATPKNSGGGYLYIGCWEVDA